MTQSGILLSGQAFKPCSSTGNQLQAGLFGRNLFYFTKCTIGSSTKKRFA